MIHNENKKNKHKYSIRTCDAIFFNKQYSFLKHINKFKKQRFYTDICLLILLNGVLRKFRDKNFNIESNKSLLFSMCV